MSHTDLGQMWLRDLRPLLVTRYPGSAGSQTVQEVSLFSVYLYFRYGNIFTGKYVTNLETLNCKIAKFSCSHLKENRN